jgi:hypothetical protein
VTIFQVILTVTDNGGQSGQTTHAIEVQPAASGYSGDWSWALTDPSLRTTDCGTFQDSRLSVDTVGDNITFREVGTSFVYSGTLAGDAFDTAYVDELGNTHTIIGSFTSGAAFDAEYNVQFSADLVTVLGFPATCEPRPVAGIKL